MAEPYIDNADDEDDEQPSLWGVPIVPMGDEGRDDFFMAPPSHPMCRCVVVPIPGVLEATERAMLSLILDVPYEWAYEYVEVRIKQLRGRHHARSNRSNRGHHHR